MGSKCVWNEAAHISRLTSLGLLAQWFQQIILNLFCHHMVDPPHFERCSIWWCPADLVLYIKKNDNVMPATASKPQCAHECVHVCVCVCAHMHVCRNSSELAFSWWLSAFVAQVCLAVSHCLTFDWVLKMISHLLQLCRIPSKLFLLSA